MADTSKREELIEEAAKAMYFEDCGFAALDDDAEPFRDMARAAFAVFEQAHTPTDDEREALATILGEPVRGTLALADRILAAGFRRTVQGEPTDAQPKRG